MQKKDKTLEKLQEVNFIEMDQDVKRHGDVDESFLACLDLCWIIYHVSFKSHVVINVFCLLYSAWLYTVSQNMSACQMAIFCLPLVLLLGFLERQDFPDFCGWFNLFWHLANHVITVGNLNYYSFLDFMFPIIIVHWDCFIFSLSSREDRLKSLFPILCVHNTSSLLGV